MKRARIDRINFPEKMRLQDEIRELMKDEGFSRQLTRIATDMTAKGHSEGWLRQEASIAGHNVSRVLDYFGVPKDPVKVRTGSMQKGPQTDDDKIGRILAIVEAIVRELDIEVDHGD